MKTEVTWLSSTRSMLIYVIAEDPINFSRPAVVKSQFGTLSGKPRELVLAERLDGKLIISKRASTSKPSWLEQYAWTWRYTDYPPASKSSMLLISRRDNNPLESCETVCCTVHKSSLWKWTGRWVVQRATKTCYWWWLLDLWTKLSGLTQAESEKDTADLRRQPIWEGAQS